PAQLLGAATGVLGPDAHRLVQDAVAVGVLLHDDDHGELREPQRDPAPPEPAVGVTRPPRRFGLADRTHAPRPVAGARPAVVVDHQLVAVQPDDPAPRAHLDEA